MDSDKVTVQLWLSERWAWAKANPWKALLYAAPFLLLLLPALLAIVLKNRDDASREIELERADLEEMDRQLADELAGHIHNIEAEGAAEIAEAKSAAITQGVKATNRVVAERDELAGDGERLIDALRGDGRKDAQ